MRPVINLLGVPATAADVPAIAALEAACMGEDAWSPDLVADAVSEEKPRIEVYVAKDGDEVVGYSIVSTVDFLAELHRIGVAAAHRRKGHARTLMVGLINRAHVGDADRMLVEVRADNAAALALYAGHDFVEVDRRPRYYRDGTDAIILRRSLGKGCGASG